MQHEDKNTTASASDAFVHMKGITKVYGNGVLANDNVDFELRRGEIHALMGENGAGKSTLMKILFGNETPDEGAIEINGEITRIDSPKKAVSLGIGMVYQHFNLAESLTVAENIVVGQEPNRGMMLDKKNACKKVNALAEKYGFSVKAEDLIRNISVGQKQKVEILKILYRDSKLIILDEPTAVLTPQETDELFEQLKLLKKNGYTLIFISHKIDEVLRLCDRLTILRAGHHIGTYDVEGMTAAEISRLMVGRDVVIDMQKPPKGIGKTVLKARELSYYNKHRACMVDRVSFDLHQGEILGIAGVEGSGQKEISEIITGLISAESGAVSVDDLALPKSVKEIRKLGISHIHEDRMTFGAAMNESIEENLISIQADDQALGDRLFLSKRKIREMSERLVKRYNVLCKSPQVPVKMLSGGNMQKVVVAREMSVEPRILVANQPTRGIDVGSVELIHRNLLQARENDCAILLISSDLNEVLGLSDRLLVMHKGQITGYFREVDRLTDEELGLYMLGLKRQSAAELKEAMGI